MIHKSGFVNIIGFPNSGKSTLINSLIGKRISIIARKPQTTRHRIMGILNQKNLQIIFSDTPGLIYYNNAIQKIMMQYVKNSFKDADILLFLTEIGYWKRIPNFLFNQIKNLENKIPIIILINKIDYIGLKFKKNILYQTIDYWRNIFPKSEIIPISALKKINQDLLIDKIKNLLKGHPPYYPKDLISDKSERFFVNEIIREKIFFMFQKEIPYSVEIKTDFFKKTMNLIRIYSSLYVERYSQKLILIGSSRKSINKLIDFSKKSIEYFFEKKVELDLRIKICKNWRSNFNQLKKFGY